MIQGAGPIPHSPGGGVIQGEGPIPHSPEGGVIQGAGPIPHSPGGRVIQGEGPIPYSPFRGSQIREANLVGVGVRQAERRRAMSGG